MASCPRLLPLTFSASPDAEFSAQLQALESLLGDIVEFLPPAELGSPLPATDAVVLPQLLGDAYRRLDAFRQIRCPILVITSEFGTVSMWDWELASYLRAEGVDTIAPYTLEQARALCRALRVKSELARAKFLVFQDDPGEGFQASIFKRFYWWENECTDRIREKFGLTIIRKSFRALGQAAREIPDSEADHILAERRVASAGLATVPLRAAAKLYLAIRRELDADPTIQACGINCLNESHFSDTTPCLAWDWLYEDRKLIWGCEGDTMAMLTKYLLHHSLDVPIMMTNMYPFLLGQAALKHERISHFPEVADPENHILVAHCGYLGVLPRTFSTEWTLRPKVLAIVDEQASAIDARLPEGDVTLAKLGPRLDSLSLAEGALTGYAQYPGSDCLNGGVIRVRNGHRLMNSLSSHHYLLMTGHQRTTLELVSRVFDLSLDVI